MNRNLLILPLLLGAALGVSLAAAEPDGCAGKKIESRVISIRFRPANEATQLIDAMLGPCGAYRAPKALRAITVEDEAENLRKIAEAIAGWDVPPPTVELTVSLIMASREPGPPHGIAGEVRGVSEMLSGLTQWTHFEKVGTATVKLMEGSEGQADLGSGYTVTFRVAAVDVNHGVIKLDPLVLLKTVAPGESASAAAGTQRSLLRYAHNLTEGRLDVVGAPNREKDRAVLIAVQAWTDLGGPPLPSERAAETPAPGK